MGRHGRAVQPRVADGGGQRRQPHADTVGAPDAGHRRHHLQREAGPVLDGAAVGIGAVVGAVAQELLQQVAVGGMHFHAVEAGRLGTQRGLAIVLDQPRDLVGAQGARHGRRLEAVLGEDAAAGLQGRRRDRRGAAFLQAGVRHAAHMPQLQHDLAAGGVHGVGHVAPRGHVVVGVDARREGVAAALAGDVGGLGDEQAGGGALGVVGGGQRCLHAVHARTGAGERGHDDAVLHIDGAQAGGGEQGRGGGHGGLQVRGLLRG